MSTITRLSEIRENNHKDRFNHYIVGQNYRLVTAGVYKVAFILPLRGEFIKTVGKNTKWKEGKKISLFPLTLISYLLGRI